MRSLDVSPCLLLIEHDKLIRLQIYVNARKLRLYTITSVNVFDVLRVAVACRGSAVVNFTSSVGPTSDEIMARIYIRVDLEIRFWTEQFDPPGTHAKLRPHTLRPSSVRSRCKIIAPSPSLSNPDSHAGLPTRSRPGILEIIKARLGFQDFTDLESREENAQQQ